MKGAVYLKDREGQVVSIDGNGRCEWKAGTLQRYPDRISTCTSTGTHTFYLFHHVTVSIFSANSKNHLVCGTFIWTVIDMSVTSSNIMFSYFLLSLSSSTGSYLCRTVPLPCWQLVSGAYQQQAPLPCATRVTASWSWSVWADSGSGALGRRSLPPGRGREGEEAQTEQGGEAVQTEQNTKPLCPVTGDQWTCPTGSVCLSNQKYRGTDLHCVFLALYCYFYNWLESFRACFVIFVMDFHWSVQMWTDKNEFHLLRVYEHWFLCIVQYMNSQGKVGQVLHLSFLWSQWLLYLKTSFWTVDTL